MHIREKKDIGRKLSCIMVLLIIAGAVTAHYLLDPWGFYRKTPDAEALLRMQTVRAAERYLGYSEADLRHKQIIDLYNSHEPLALGYTVQYTDSWCAAYVSAVAIEQALTDIIPTECGCERQIGLWQDRGRWQEWDSYIPLPGDLIYYDWDETKTGSCTGWSDHVGMVVGTKWPFIKVIEGNKDDMVTYRVLPVGHIHIRGFGLPDYAAKAKDNTAAG